MGSTSTTRILSDKFLNPFLKSVFKCDYIFHTDSHTHSALRFHTLYIFLINIYFHADYFPCVSISYGVLWSYYILVLLSSVLLFFGLIVVISVLLSFLFSISVLSCFSSCFFVSSFFVVSSLFEFRNIIFPHVTPKYISLKFD